MTRKHVGGGVFASFDGQGIWLSTADESDRIYLDLEAITGLGEYGKNIAQSIIRDVLGGRRDAEGDE